MAPRTRHLLLLAAVAAVYLHVRWDGIGHLLSWDEAVTLCSIRSFVAGGTDSFANWFWRHGPLLQWFISLLSPLTSGFAERSQACALGIGLLTLVTLYGLNRSVLGVPAALWSCFCLALMPGAILFDTWVKQDGLVALCGLAALYCAHRRRELLCGLCLGLALLSKETAVFYVATVWLMAWFADDRPAALRRSFRASLIAGLLAAWWYLLFNSGVRLALLFALGSSQTEVEHWSGGWYYYAARLPESLGLAGVLLLFLGLLASLALARTWGARPSACRPPPRPDALWAVFFLLVAGTVLSAARGKVPWMMQVFLPALATVQGFGVQRFLAWGLADARRRLSICRRPVLRHRLRWTLGFGAALAVVGVAGELRPAYDDRLNHMDEGLYIGALASRQAACAVNARVREGERLLLSKFFYWRYGECACPIFLMYLTRVPEVIVIEPTTSKDDIVTLIRQYHMDWALLSPAPPPDGPDVLAPLVREYNLFPIVTRGACLLHTSSMYNAVQGPQP